MPVELTNDRAFSGRVIRLAATSAVVLGLLWASGTTLDANPSIEKALAGGWILMPSILALSLRWPRLRYALMLPSVMVVGALLAITATALPESLGARVGWLLITLGVLEGSVLGMWFWFRWVPVPVGLDDPFARARWLLIFFHVASIVVGLVLVRGWLGT